VEWIHVDQGRLWGWCGVDSCESRQVMGMVWSGFM
jgi:hypothetical protein